MKIKKLIIINTTVFLGTVILVTGCNQNISSDLNANSSVNQSSNSINESVEISDEKVTNSKDNTQNNQTFKENNTTNSTEVITPVVDEQTVDYTSDDKVVIETFNDINEEIDVMLQSEENETIKEKAKGTFITIVDFIFYDAEIKGIKFDDLTEGAKENILETAHLIDSKIENKFPNYKETISDKTSNAYNKASEVIKKGANNVKEFSKEKLGEDNYNAIVDAKDELVYYTKNAFDIVGDVTSNLWESGKSKIKTWYENFKNNQ